MSSTGVNSYNAGYNYPRSPLVRAEQAVQAGVSDLTKAVDSFQSALTTLDSDLSSSSDDSNQQSASGTAASSGSSGSPSTSGSTTSDTFASFLDALQQVINSYSQTGAQSVSVAASTGNSGETSGDDDLSASSLLSQASGSTSTQAVATQTSDNQTAQSGGLTSAQSAILASAIATPTAAAVTSASATSQISDSGLLQSTLLG